MLSLPRNNNWLIVRGEQWSRLAQLGVTPKKVARWLGVAKLSPEQQALLELMQKDNAKAKRPYRAENVWSRLAEIFEDYLYVEGVGNVEERDINSYFACYPPGHIIYYRFCCQALYGLLKQRDKWGLLKKVRPSARGKSGRLQTVDGLTVSWDYLISMEGLISMAEVDGSILKKPVVVADLGAGWGRMTYVIKQANPKATVLIFDLPEVLMVSQHYLPAIMEECKFVDYKKVRTMAKISRRELLNSPGVWFGGSQDLEKVEAKTVDFFVSTFSFQEMTKWQVGKYFEVIEEKTRGFLYLLQHWNAATSKRPGVKDYPFGRRWERMFVRKIPWDERFFESMHKIR